MVAVFLITNKKLPTAKYLLLFSILVAVMCLTHVPAAVAFSLFLAVYGILSKNRNFRIDDAIKSSILGFLYVIIIYHVFSTFTARFVFNTSLLIALACPFAALFLSLLVRKITNRGVLSLGIKPRIVNTKFLKGLAFSLLFFYMVAVLSWMTLSGSFHTRQVDPPGLVPVGLVPWPIYPLMLGINGFLAIVALFHLTRQARSYDVLIFFAAFMVFAFVAGRIVSTVNIHFFNAGYWEKRFIWLIKLPLAVFAPIPLLFSVDRLKTMIFKPKLRAVASVALIGTVVLYGIPTTFLNIEYWSIVSGNQPSSEEMEAIIAFKELLDNEPRTWVATVTEKSAAMATLAAPADQLVLKQLLYTACTPEMALTQLYRHPAYSHPFIYLHTRDKTKLDINSDRFLTQYAAILPLIYENSEVKIHNVSKLSFPQPNSKTMLVLPLDKLVDRQKLHMAYHVLSQGFYNYSVAYDVDDEMLKADTAILAFDPPRKNVLTNHLEEEFNQTLVSWTTSTGSWRIADGELIGGESGKLGEGTILSRMSAENFTAAFSARPLKGSVDTLNYISLVYSHVDSKNYRMADIMFSTDGFIYIHIRTVVDGVEETLPDWPGIKTDLRWEFGSKYNVKVVVSGALNQVYINDNLCVSLNLDNLAGRVGLRYFRFYEASFDNFSISYSASLRLRPTNDYLEHLQSGGRVIILNTNGYGFFAEHLFLFQQSEINAKRVEGTGVQEELPMEILTPELIPKEVDTVVLSHYRSEVDHTPYIVKQDFGAGELTYVNLYPITQAIRGTNAQPAFYGLLGRLLDDLNLPKLDPNVMLSFDGYVREIQLHRDGKVETSSLLFPLESEFEINVESEDGSQIFHNVTSMAIAVHSEAIVEADSITVMDGEGFYTTLETNSTFSVKPSAGLMSLEIATKDGVSSLDQVIQFIATPLGSVELLARTPALSGSEVTFIEFYPSASLQWSTRTSGQNLEVNGLTRFAVALSDSYSALTNVKLGASFERDPPIVSFDEFSTLSIAGYWILLLLPPFLGIMLSFTVGHRKDRKREPARGGLDATS
jgi:hypothetical protein